MSEPGIPIDSSNSAETIILIILVAINCGVCLAGSYFHMKNRTQGNINARLPPLLTLNNMFMIAFSILAVVSCRHHISRRITEVGLLTLMTMVVVVQFIRATRLVFLNEVRYRMSKDTVDAEGLEHSFFSEESYDEEDDYSDNYDDYWYDDDDDDEEDDSAEYEVDDRSFNASYTNWQELLDEFSDLESEDDDYSDDDSDSAEYSKNRRRAGSLSEDDDDQQNSRLANQQDVKLPLHYRINHWFVLNKYMSTVFYMVGFTIFIFFKVGLLITIFVSTINPQHTYVLWYAMFIISILVGLSVFAVLKYIRIRQYQMFIEKNREYREKYDRTLYEDHDHDDDDDDDEFESEIGKDSRMGSEASQISSGGKPSLKHFRPKRVTTGDKALATLQAADDQGQINLFGVTLGVVKDRPGNSRYEGSVLSQSHRTRTGRTREGTMSRQSTTSNSTSNTPSTKPSSKQNAPPVPPGKEVPGQPLSIFDKSNQQDPTLNYELLKKNHGFPMDLYNKMTDAATNAAIPDPPVEPPTSIFTSVGDGSGFLMETLITAFMCVISYSIALIAVLIGHGTYDHQFYGEVIIAPTVSSAEFTRVMIIFLVLGHICVAYYSTLHVFARGPLEDLFAKLTGRPQRSQLAEAQFDELDSLKKILADAGAREEFRVFLESEFSGENLLFWNAVEEFRVKLPYHFDKRAESVASAKYIFSTYLAQGGVYEVNISAQCREKITQKLKKLTEEDPLRECRARETWEITEALKAHYEKGSLYHFFDHVSGERYVGDVETESGQPRSAKILAKICSEPVTSAMATPIAPATLERFTYYQIMEIFGEISKTIEANPKQTLGQSHLSRQQTLHRPMGMGGPGALRGGRTGAFDDDDDGQRIMGDDASDDDHELSPYGAPPSFPHVLPNVIEHQFLMNVARRIDGVHAMYRKRSRSSSPQRGPLAAPPGYRARRRGGKKQDRQENPDAIHQLNKNTLMCFDWKVAAARRRLVTWTEHAEDMSQVFDSAQTEVFKLMERDSYARFAKSTGWKQYVMERAQAAARRNL